MANVLCQIVIIFVGMENPENNDLLMRLAGDDQLAMKEIFHTFYPGVYRSIFRITRQKEISEDLTQEVFLKFWNKRGSLSINHTLAGYLNTMAYHEALAHLRKKSNYLTSPQEFNDSDLQVDGNLEIEGRDLQSRLDDEIDKLPPRCRGVFILSRYEGKSYKEISDLMEISVKTVENQIGKALSVLRVSLRDLITTLLIMLF